MSNYLMNKILRRLRKKSKPRVDEPTIFHICHHKTGSQWVKEVLSHSEGSRVVTPKPKSLHLKGGQLHQGLIYPTVYMTSEEFYLLLASYPELKWKCFFILRDLRDTLVSLYFSLKYSHKVVSQNVGKQKSNLQNLDVEEGLLYLIENGLKVQNDIQLSWVNQKNDIKVYRYEDLITDQESVFRDMFDYCEIDCDDEEFRQIIRSNSFENMSGGRKRGTEDIHNHQRKGISGDWKNYFTDNVKGQFKDKFADTLIQTGYETDVQW